MLVLTRRRGEEIFIGPNIRVVVLGVEAGRAVLGVDAPKNVSVQRREVLERLLNEVNPK